MTMKEKIAAMFRAKAADWGLTDFQINTAVDLAMTDTAEFNDLRLFLYAKGFLDDSCPIEIAATLDILTSSNLRLVAARTRLLAIIEPQAAPPIPRTPLFTEFIEKHPEWAESDSYVFHRDDERVRGRAHVLKERVQLSVGLCYIHAPAVMQHYLLSIGMKDAPTLDIHSFVRKHVQLPLLKHHIWSGTGGNSLELLRRILYSKPRPVEKMICTPSMMAVEENCIINYLKCFGPGLVSNFIVYDSFNAENAPHLTEKRGNHVGMHSMVLIGHRSLGDGTHRYLLQNWWASLPYVEVDMSYLIDCDAQITFITTPQFSMGDLDSSMADYEESAEGLDACEEFILERSS